MKIRVRGAFAYKKTWDRIRATEDRAWLPHARILALELPGAEVDQVAAAFNRIWGEYAIRLDDAASFESASQARKDLEALASATEALAGLIQDLNPGAHELMERKPFNLGDSLTPFIRGPNLLNPSAMMEREARLDPWGRGAAMLARLRTMADQARRKAQWTEDAHGTGGRTPLSATLSGGTPDDWLASECRAFLETHGKSSQAAIQRMMHVVMKVATGRKPSTHAGRNAVRKMVRTEQV